VGEPGRGGAHGAPAMRLEMPPGRRGRSESGSTRAQRWERERSEAEAGPVQGGDGGHDFFFRGFPPCIRAGRGQG
jgi:hypothetical protein